MCVGGGGGGSSKRKSLQFTIYQQSVSQQEFGDAICYIPEGTKLKVYGESFVHMNKKKNNKKEPGIDVSRPLTYNVQCTHQYSP